VQAAPDRRGRGENNMKRGMLMLAMALLALGARGGELKPELVPAQATWFAHLDVEKLLASQVGAKLLEEIKADVQLTAQFDAIQNTVGVDLRKDIKGLSLFGPDTQKDRGVMVFRGPANTDKLLTVIKANPSHEELAEGDLTMHKWTDKGHDNYGFILPGGICVISGYAEAARVTAQVMHSGQGGLTAESTLGGLAKSGADCILHAAVDGQVGLPGGQPQAAVLKKIVAADLKLNERDAKVSAELTLLADSPASAAQLADVVRGLIAYGQLAEDLAPQWKQLALAAAVAQSGTQIKLTAGCTAAELVEWIKKARGGHHQVKSSATAAGGGT
jgi:hypothetical protein